MTQWHAATDAGVPAVEKFLSAHIETSVFLISNLRKYGPAGADAPYAMTYWMTFDPDRPNRVAGVIAQSSGGTVMGQWPDATTGQNTWRDALACVPSPITGVIGDGPQMTALIDAAGLTDAPTNLYAKETLFMLDLRDLKPQPGPGQLRHLTDADRTVLLPWRTDYAINTLGEPAATGPARAEREITTYIAEQSHRLLVEGETILSMTGFNATVNDVVQVGGVYTPPDKRGQGLARRAVALHLQEACDAGVKRAILFANDPSAMAAYRAVGFIPTGQFLLAMFASPQEVS